MNIKIGFGYDVHPLVQGKKLILGGVHIPYEKGGSGHSDADVLIHSLCDAILGALALGDIGNHFPDSDPTYKDFESILFLRKVYSLMKQQNFEIGNIDSHINLENPKIFSYISEMKKSILSVLPISTEQISIKAGTNEKLGFIGQGDGISAYTVVLLNKFSV